LSEKRSSILHSVGDNGVGDSPRGKTFGKKGIYLLPNLVTTGALFAGFYAIIAAMSGDFLPAIYATLLAMFLDTADGRIARVTATESEFGAQFDSLSDMVAFGVAPAVLAFSWSLSTLGQIGWIVSFIYMACAALRLARFNSTADSSDFTGLASPSAAGLVVFSIWVAVSSGISSPKLSLSLLALALTAGAGLLMVSNFKYFSPKGFKLKEKIPFVSLVLIVMAFAIIALDPPRVLLFMCVVYSLSGPAVWVWKRFMRGS